MSINDRCWFFEWAQESWRPNTIGLSCVFIVDYSNLISISISIVLGPLLQQSSTNHIFWSTDRLIYRLLQSYIIKHAKAKTGVLWCKYWISLVHYLNSAFQFKGCAELSMCLVTLVLLFLPQSHKFLCFLSAWRKIWQSWTWEHFIICDIRELVSHASNQLGMFPKTIN